MAESSQQSDDVPSADAGNTSLLKRRPRSLIARLLYDRIMREGNPTDVSPKTAWYELNVTKYAALSKSPGAEYVASKFIEMDANDPETILFLKNSASRSDNIPLQLYHNVATSFCSLFLRMTKTSINGLVGRGSMFVFSPRQLASLLPQTVVDSRFEEDKFPSLIDLGAGDGAQTRRLATMSDIVYVTEISSTMIWRMTGNGYHFMDIKTWHEDGVRPADGYDVVSCLNLIDRCAKPLTLLQNVFDALKPGGIALVAFVIPLKPFVEFETKDNKPLEKLQVTCATSKDSVHMDSGFCFFLHAVTFVENVAKKIGFELVSWTRLPYLCEGDLTRPFYKLDDVLFVLKKPKIDADP